MKTKCTRFDIVLSVGILLLALLIALLPIFLQKKAQLLKITSENGEEFYTLGQTKEIEIFSHGHTLTVYMDEDGVCVSRSDCSDKVCKNSGKIHRSGDMIICAPAGVKLELVADKGGLDYVVG